MTPQLEAVFRLITQMSDEDQDYWAGRILDKIAALKAQGLTAPPARNADETTPSE